MSKAFDVFGELSDEQISELPYPLAVRHALWPTDYVAESSLGSSTSDL